MTTTAVTSNLARAIEYCRQARKVRHRLAADPVRMHRALRELAKPVEPERPTPPPAPVKPEPAVVCPSVLLGVGPDREEAVRRFVTHVRMRLVGSTVLTNAQRTTLLQVASTLRVERFHANLVIASLEHEARQNDMK
jgi:hypothetical protein